MSTTIEISDDDDSFNVPDPAKPYKEAVSPGLSSMDSGSSIMSMDNDNVTSDEDSNLPCVNVSSKRTAAVKKLFPDATKTLEEYKCVPKKSYSVPSDVMKAPSFVKMIGGIKINFPVDPYGCQVALMFKVITAINKSQNCLLESPTGTGKTLALLCSALAWQQAEQSRSSQQLAEQYFSSHPELNSIPGAKEYVASSSSSNDVTPEKLFTKTTFGEKSIYDKPIETGSGDGSCGSKRNEPMHDSSESPSDGAVKIHKKPRLHSGPLDNMPSPERPSTPIKNCKVEAPETPQQIRVPTIYYGARTHKQIQQVVKEFQRTVYCGTARMSLLSSREYTCIRDMDRNLWKSKDDMCRGCVKSFQVEDRPKKESNCKFYDNRAALCHKSLPAAFDLEELVATGERLKACPYYAARQMAPLSNIIFCPYNYLIQPSIRNSMKINLTDNIVIIDEGHNIEDICRDAATMTFTRDNILGAIKELDTAAKYRYANQNVLSNIDILLLTLKCWDQWFVNQLPLVENKAVNNNEAIHTWQIEHFVDSLENNDIGKRKYNEFQQSAEKFCKQLREDPRTLYGVTQATGTLIESIDTALGYLFRFEGKYMDDFRPVLVKTVYSNQDSLSAATSWRNVNFQKSVERSVTSLRLLCMNSAVVFESLRASRCVLLTSGTLTPLHSLQSELGLPFPLLLSPSHNISPDRVWVGSLSTCPAGARLECSSRALEGGAGGGGGGGAARGVGGAVLHAARVTPHGVLCFLPSYTMLNKLITIWRACGIWEQLNNTKHVFIENRNVKDHDDIMKDYYNYVGTDKGALLFAVYRGKVSEGMDFKDHQARAVITVGIPYPNTYDIGVKEKMKYNDKYSVERNLLPSREWLRVQAYRALNQAVGRCVRHRLDWGAVLLIDARFSNPYYTEHLSKWVKNFLGNNHHTFDSLVNSSNSLDSFMQNMKIRENEDGDLT